MIFKVNFPYQLYIKAIQDSLANLLLIFGKGSYFIDGLFCHQIWISRVPFEVVG